MKLSAILEQYEYIKHTTEVTKKSYRSKIGQFDKAICYRSANDLTIQHVLDWRDTLIERGCRNTSVNSNIVHCRAVFQFAIDQGIVQSEKNIFNIQRLPEVRKSKTINDQTVSQAFKALEEAKGSRTWFWGTVIHTQMSLGVRNRQIINIKVGDLDLESDTLYLSAEGSKVRKSNCLPISENLKAILLEYLSMSKEIMGRQLYRHEYLFVAGRYFDNYKCYKSKMMSPDQLQSMYRLLSTRVEKVTGERITGHRLRHTLASKIGAKHDVNIRVIQEWFGWSSIQTAQSYVKVSLDQKRNLIENI